jgi:type VI protein secretion system component Hcp
MALFFKPGDKGVKVEIAFTKEASTGEGVVKVYEIKLDKVRIAEYKVEAEDEAVPTETFTLTYTEISQNVSVQDGAGMANTGDVTFDLASATLTSAMKDALK